MPDSNPSISDTGARVLLPFGFAKVGAHLLVQLVDPDRLDWQQGFFIRSLPQENPFAAFKSLAEWEADSPCLDHFAGVGGIFHVSRCGSTLLAQNLKATGQAVVLSEPPFMRVLRTRLDGALDADRARAVMCTAIAQWRDWAASVGRRLVVKFNSQMHQWADEIMSALPGARFLFLHREPAAVFESIERGPPRYLQREAADSRHHGLPELAAIDEDPILMAAARRYCGALDVFETAHADVAHLSYTALADSFPAICRHFGLPDVDAWNAVHNAKASASDKASPYRPVSTRQMEDFVAQHGPLLRVANARYAAFLDVASARGTSLQ